MTSVSTFGTAQTQLDNLKTLLGKVSDLQTQVATGEKSQTFAGLGTDAIISERSRANLGSLDVYDTNITNGQTRLNVMNDAVSQIQSQANSIANAMSSEIQNGNFDLKTLNSLATNGLDFIKNLLNQQDGSTYVFGGSASSTPPLTDTGTLATASQTAVAQWTAGTITTDQLIASYTDPTQITDSMIGYSAPLASGTAQPVSIKADADSSVDYTVLANNPAFRNLLTAITTVQSLTSSLTQVASTSTDPTGTVTAPGSTSAAQSTNFYSVFNNLISTIQSSATSIDQVSAKLGYAQSNLTSIQTDHTQDENVLQNYVTGAENVDMNTVAVTLSSLQTQLQASYQVTAAMQQYSLANYLTF